MFLIFTLCAQYKCKCKLHCCNQLLSAGLRDVLMPLMLKVSHFMYIEQEMKRYFHLKAYNNAYRINAGYLFVWNTSLHLSLQTAFLLPLMGFWSLKLLLRFYKI